MTDKIDTKVVQVSNIAPNATRDQMKTLFSYLGRIDDIKMYPSESSELQVTAKVCYVKYDDYTSVGVALHLTNTVFIDRALIVIPVMDGQIPDEQSALQRASSAVAGMLQGHPTWPSNVISQLQSVGGSMVIITHDPRLTALGLPQYPPLPSNTDPGRIEEIRRTVYVSNLDSSVIGEVILSFFAQVGEIKYVRMGGDEMEGGKCAYVEFTDQRSIATALTYNGVMFHGRPLSVAHSNSAIEKPKTKMQEAAQREIDEAMKKVKEAQSLITAAADSGDLNIEKTVSKLASGLGRSRSRSRSPSRRHRTRSRSHKRSSRSRSHHRSSRSRRRSKSSHRSRSRRKSQSVSRKRSRSADVSKTATGSTGLKKPGPGMPGGPGTGLRKAEYPGKPTGPGVGPSYHQHGSKSLRKRSRSHSRSPRRSSSRSRKRRSSRSRSKRRSGSRTRRSHSRRRSRSRRKSRSPHKTHTSPRKVRTPPRKSRTPPRKRTRSLSGSPPKLRREGSERLSSDGKSGKESSRDVKSFPVKVKSTEKKRSSSRGRSRSRSPLKKIRKARSRSRSKGRRSLRTHKSRSTSRKRSLSRTRHRSRSRSGSKHRQRKDKRKDKERECSKEREKERDKKKIKEKEKEEKKDNKIHRDYDEEEQTLYNDEEDKRHDDYKKSDEEDEDDDEDDRSQDVTVSSPEPIPTRVTVCQIDTDLQQVDMDMSD